MVQVERKLAILAEPPNETPFQRDLNEPAKREKIENRISQDFSLKIQQ